MRDLDARGQEERGGGRCVHGSLSVCRCVARLHEFTRKYPVLSRERRFSFNLLIEISNPLVF